MKQNIAIVGSGNWGSCIARICATNVINLDCFNDEVRMWIHEETVDGKNLSEIINTQHENVKYLAGVRLPDNIVAVTDLAELGEWADLLVFVLPQQFLQGVCDSLKGHLRPEAFGVSLIKGVLATDQGDLHLLSDLIRGTLNIDCAVLMGANLAPEVARGTYCEATIGCRNAVWAAKLKQLFSTNYFRLITVNDEIGVELCGSLKNIVATAAGFCDALKYGDNTKAAVIRLGLMEIMRFILEFYPARGVSKWTLLQSCGLGDIISSCYNTREVIWAGVSNPDSDPNSHMTDLVTTCYGGRNRKLAAAMVKTGKSLQQLEGEMLNGQRLQGPLTASVVYHMLLAHNELARCPLMVSVHLVCSGQLKPEQLIDQLRNHPEHG